MDNKKDIQFNTDQKTAVEPSTNSVFSSDHEAYLALIKKTEKLITALYMVTDCMEGEEPLKRQLRQLGVRLLGEIHAAMSVATIESTLRLQAALQSVEEIHSLLGITATVGFISEMNFTVLEREFTDLQQQLLKTKGQTRQFSLPHAFFPGRKPQGIRLSDQLFSSEASRAGKEEKTGEDNKGHIKDMYPTRQPSAQREKDHPPGNLAHKGHKDTSKALAIGLKHERRSLIIRLVKDKKEVSIKDISLQFSEVSEKTIQRELMSLVQEGVLKKEGEKRWSRYSLNRGPVASKE